MTGEKKLRVYIPSAWPREKSAVEPIKDYEEFEGNVDFIVDNDRLKMRLGAPTTETIAIFNSWRYVRFIEDTFADALNEIRNLVTCGNPPAEKLHFIGMELHKIGLLDEKEIPSKE